MAFKEDFVQMFKLSLRKDVFSLSQGAYASSQLRLSSMLILKYFIFSTLLITSLVRTRFHISLPTLFNFLLWPTTINSLLLAFTISCLFSSSLIYFPVHFSHLVLGH